MTTFDIVMALHQENFL